MSNSGDHSTPNKSRKVRKNGEGSIFYDKKRERWVASFFDIKSHRRTQTFHREPDATKWLENCISLRDRGHGTHADKPRQTVDEFLNEWLEHSKPSLRYNTYRNYQQTIKYRISPYIGELRVMKLKSITIEKMFNQLIELDYSGGTINGVYRTLSKAFNDGVRLDLIPFNPLLKVKNPRIESQPSSAIPKAHVELLYKEASKNPSDLARLLVGTQFGLRPGEIAGLQWDDLNEQDLNLMVRRQVQYEPGKGHIYCPPKTLRRDPLPLTSKEMEILLRHKKHQELLTIVEYSSVPSWKGDRNIMFPNAHGNLQNAKSDRIWFQRLCDRAGTPRYERYQMRKTAFTSLLLESDIGTVMAYSGHTQSSTLLKHYISPETNALRSAIGRRESNSVIPELDVNEINEL